MANFDATLECEPPNEKLNKFEGTLTWKELNT
jgi:hypothetical protein